MFIPSYLISLDLVVLMHQGHLMPPTVSLDLFHIYTLILLWVIVSLREGPTPPALFPLPEACIQDMACLTPFPNDILRCQGLIFPNLFTPIFLNLLTIRIRKPVLQLLQQKHLSLPCLLKICSSNHPSLGSGVCAVECD